MDNPSCIVQVDKRVTGVMKTKCNVARVVTTKSILSIYDATDKKGVIIHFKNRNPSMLVKQSFKAPATRTEIWTDCLCGYNHQSTLDNESLYIHKPMNHSKDCLDPSVRHAEIYWKIFGAS